MKKNQANFEINAGIAEFEAGRLQGALGFFKLAVVKASSEGEPWFWMGRVYEDLGDRVLAGHCFYMACDMGSTHESSLKALRRLGYCDTGHGYSVPNPPQYRYTAQGPSIQGVKP